MSVQVRGSGGSIAGVDANGNVQVVLPDATTPEKLAAFVTSLRMTRVRV